LPPEVACSGSGLSVQFGAIMFGGSTWSAYTRLNRRATASVTTSPVRRHRSVSSGRTRRTSASSVTTEATTVAP